MILQPYTEHAPDSRQIQECAAQLAAGGRTNYGESVQKYAKLRTADFSAALADWENEAYAAAIGQKPLQNVANALKMKVMSTDLSEKMLAFLQNAAKQGDTTAMLYLAYLHSIGRFAKPSLHTAAKLLHAASEQGDWRASQFWGELLAASPAAARELLNDEFQAAAETWLAQHPETAPARAEQAYRRFYEASAAIKWAAKSKFTRAQEQGSPTAEQRIKGLTALGSLPAAQPAPQFQDIGIWLENQLLKKQTPLPENGDIMLMPENVPLLPQSDDDGKETWHKIALIGGFILIGALVLALVAQMMLKK